MMDSLPVPPVQVLAMSSLPDVGGAFAPITTHDAAYWAPDSEYRAFAAGLQKTLAAFDTAREWADLSAFVRRLSRLLRAFQQSVAARGCTMAGDLLPAAGDLLLVLDPARRHSTHALLSEESDLGLDLDPGSGAPAGWLSLRPPGAAAPGGGASSAPTASSSSSGEGALPSVANGGVDSTRPAYPGAPVPDPVGLARRLAQCLHPALPSGVHLEALAAYQSLFSLIGPIRLARDLDVCLSGLLVTTLTAGAPQPGAGAPSSGAPAGARFLPSVRELAGLVPRDRLTSALPGTLLAGVGQVLGRHSDPHLQQAGSPAYGGGGGYGGVAAHIRPQLVRILGSAVRASRSVYLRTRLPANAGPMATTSPTAEAPSDTSGGLVLVPIGAAALQAASVALTLALLPGLLEDDLVGEDAAGAPAAAATAGPATGSSSTAATLLADSPTLSALASSDSPPLGASTSMHHHPAPGAGDAPAPASLGDLSSGILLSLVAAQAEVEAHFSSPDTGGAGLAEQDRQLDLLVRSVSRAIVDIGPGPASGLPLGPRLLPAVHDTHAPGPAGGLCGCLPAGAAWVAAPHGAGPGSGGAGAGALRLAGLTFLREQLPEATKPLPMSEPARGALLTAVKTALLGSVPHSAIGFTCYVLPPAAAGQVHAHLRAAARPPADLASMLSLTEWPSLAAAPRGSVHGYRNPDVGPAGRLKAPPPVMSRPVGDDASLVTRAALDLMCDKLPWDCHGQGPERAETGWLELAACAVAGVLYECFALFNSAVLCCFQPARSLDKGQAFRWDDRPPADFTLWRVVTGRGDPSPGGPGQLTPGDPLFDRPVSAECIRGAAICWEVGASPAVTLPPDSLALFRRLFTWLDSCAHCAAGPGAEHRSPPGPCGGQLVALLLRRLASPAARARLALLLSFLPSLAPQQLQRQQQQLQQQQQPDSPVQEAALASGSAVESPFEKSVQRVCLSALVAEAPALTRSLRVHCTPADPTALSYSWELMHGRLALGGMLTRLALHVGWPAALGLPPLAPGPEGLEQLRQTCLDLLFLADILAPHGATGRDDQNFLLTLLDFVAGVLAMLAESTDLSPEGLDLLRLLGFLARRGVEAAVPAPPGGQSGLPGRDPLPASLARRLVLATGHLLGRHADLATKRGFCASMMNFLLAAVRMSTVPSSSGGCAFCHVGGSAERCLLAVMLDFLQAPGTWESPGNPLDTEHGADPRLLLRLWILRFVATRQPACSVAIGDMPATVLSENLVRALVRTCWPLFGAGGEAAQVELMAGEVVASLQLVDTHRALVGLDQPAAGGLLASALDRELIDLFSMEAACSGPGGHFVSLAHLRLCRFLDFLAPDRTSHADSLALPMPAQCLFLLAGTARGCPCVCCPPGPAGGDGPPAADPRHFSERQICADTLDRFLFGQLTHPAALLQHSVMGTICEVLLSSAPGPGAGPGGGQIDTARAAFSLDLLGWLLACDRRGRGTVAQLRAGVPSEHGSSLGPDAVLFDQVVECLWRLTFFLSPTPGAEDAAHSDGGEAPRIPAGVQLAASEALRRLLALTSGRSPHGTSGSRASSVPATSRRLLAVRSLKALASSFAVSQAAVTQGAGPGGAEDDRLLASHLVLHLQLVDLLPARAPGKLHGRLPGPVTDTGSTLPLWYFLSVCSVVRRVLTGPGAAFFAAVRAGEAPCPALLSRCLLQRALWSALLLLIEGRLVAAHQMSLTHIAPVEVTLGADVQGLLDLLRACSLSGGDVSGPGLVLVLAVRTMSLLHRIGGQLHGPARRSGGSPGTGGPLDLAGRGSPFDAIIALAWADRVGRLSDHVSDAGDFLGGLCTLLEGAFAGRPAPPRTLDPGRQAVFSQHLGLILDLVPFFMLSIPAQQAPARRRVLFTLAGLLAVDGQLLLRSLTLNMRARLLVAALRPPVEQAARLPEDFICDPATRAHSWILCWLTSMAPVTDGRPHACGRALGFGSLFGPLVEGVGTLLLLLRQSLLLPVGSAGPAEPRSDALAGSPGSDRGLTTSGPVPASAGVADALGDKPDAPGPGWDEALATEIISALVALCSHLSSLAVLARGHPLRQAFPGYSLPLEYLARPLEAAPVEVAMLLREPGRLRGRGGMATSGLGPFGRLGPDTSGLGALLLVVQTLSMDLAEAAQRPVDTAILRRRRNPSTAAGALATGPAAIEALCLEAGQLDHRPRLALACWLSFLSGVHRLAREWDAAVPVELALFAAAGTLPPGPDGSRRPGEPIAGARPLSQLDAWRGARGGGRCPDGTCLPAGAGPLGANRPGPASGWPADDLPSDVCGAAGLNQGADSGASGDDDPAGVATPGADAADTPAGPAGIPSSSAGAPASMEKGLPGAGAGAGAGVGAGSGRRLATLISDPYQACLEALVTLACRRNDRVSWLRRRLFPSSANLHGLAAGEGEPALAGPTAGVPSRPPSPVPDGPHLEGDPHRPAIGHSTLSPEQLAEATFFFGAHGVAVASRCAVEREGAIQTAVCGLGWDFGTCARGPCLWPLTDSPPAMVLLSGHRPATPSPPPASGMASARCRSSSAWPTSCRPSRAWCWTTRPRWPT
ncbi:hypothetical protein, variant [Fonticula alba]|uniref:DOP1 N-terminal domain-containing protein n=1 Tax=Fonticula alba TaxID=691883 RepID=A0A058Z1Z1_FONAL|nr:hypothetical protein, variant [Fonticula alba]KCV68304.1 hypothetical protein, variant [Fonticula alba]|eukprot:XP_009497358.1 hypothetical protein, variant [Fonticula alba]